MKSAAHRKRGCKYWFKLLAVGLMGGFGLAYCGIMALDIASITRTAPDPNCCSLPTDSTFAYESINFTSSDGVTLFGWYVPSKNRAAVILLHGYGANRSEMRPRAEMLAQDGFGVLMYDMRGHGQSGGNQRSFGWTDVNDVTAALKFLHHRSDVDPTRIGILGFSIGRQVAMRAAAQTDASQAVIDDGPSLARAEDIPSSADIGEWLFKLSNWLEDRVFSVVVGVPAPAGVAEVIGHISPRPLMIIATGPDSDVEQRLAQYYFDQAREPKIVWKIPEAQHGTGPAVRPTEYAQIITDFFDKALLGKGR
jgi:uncharacterized protein